MTTPRERPHFASPDGRLGRLTAGSCTAILELARRERATGSTFARRATVTALAWTVAGAVVTQAVATVLTPLPLALVTPAAQPVVARTPVGDFRP